MKLQDNYQELCLRTLATAGSVDETIKMSGFGLANEWGEFLSLLDSYFSGETPCLPPLEQLNDEFGDVLWYFAVLSCVCGVTFSDVLPLTSDYKNSRSTGRQVLVVKAAKVSMHIGLLYGDPKKYLWHGHAFPNIATLEKHMKST